MLLLPARRLNLKQLALACYRLPIENGGAERDRTADPLLAKQVLSQLSYSPYISGLRGKPLRPLALLTCNRARSAIHPCPILQEG